MILLFTISAKLENSNYGWNSFETKARKGPFPKLKGWEGWKLDSKIAPLLEWVHQNHQRKTVRSKMAPALSDNNELFQEKDRNNTQQYYE